MNAEDPIPYPNAPQLRYFEYSHLPPHLQEFSKPFADLARFIANKVPAGEQREFAFQKLIEAKDCAVRAALPLKPPPKT